MQYNVKVVLCKNLGRLWLAYIELRGNFQMLQLIYWHWKILCTCIMDFWQPMTIYAVHP